MRPADHDEILRLRYDNLIDSRDCPVCRLKIKYGLDITNRLLMKFEHDHIGPLRFTEVEDPVERFVHYYPIKGQEYKKHIAALERLGDIKGMGEKEFVKSCLFMQDLWLELEADRKETDRKAKVEAAAARFTQIFSEKRFDST